MTYTKSQLTQYAHEYLQGSNLVPIGALDNAYFRQEVRRLWGPEPTQEEQEAQRRRAEKILNRLIRARSKLLGPRGGAPKSGPAREQYKNLQWNIDMIQAQL